ncbi:DUF697 domain-containing protein [Hydrogenophaga atypica]|uniref:DUF697 domain-containing protein n=1 Tax=Hydrogenophaga atypica TaxID=249409 RepID=A0ABW2QJB5_9BURK
MKHFYRLMLVFAVVLGVYAALSVVATFSQLADAADRLMAGAGTPVFWVLLLAFVGLVAWPTILMMRLPRMQLPPRDTSEPAYSRHQSWLKKHLSAHPDMQVQTLARRDDLPSAMGVLDEQARRLIQQTAGGVFISTALIQNGRLDGLVMLGMQLKLIGQLAALYRLRPTPRQITYLYGNVAGTMLLSSQLDDLDFKELAAPIVSSVAPSLATAIPGMQGVGQLLVNSMASGSANAFLTLRVGLIAQAYCMPSVEPAQAEVRQSATRLALAMLGTIAREQGQKIALGVWGSVKQGTVDTVQSATQGVRRATKAAKETVKATTTTVADTVVSTADGVITVAVAGTQAVLDTGVKVGKGAVEAAQSAGEATAETAVKATAAIGSSSIKGAKAVADVGEAAIESAGKLFKRKSGNAAAPPDDTKQIGLL